jgi:hypothetical protein
MLVYICFYRSRKILVTASSSYEAQLEAARQLRLKPKQRYEVSVHLADQPINTASL